MDRGEVQWHFPAKRCGVLARDVRNPSQSPRYASHAPERKGIDRQTRRLVSATTELSLSPTASSAATVRSRSHQPAIRTSFVASARPITAPRSGSRGIRSLRGASAAERSGCDRGARCSDRRRIDLQLQWRFRTCSHSSAYLGQQLERLNARNSREVLRRLEEVTFFRGSVRVDERERDGVSDAVGHHRLRLLSVERHSPHARPGESCSARLPPDT